jgi:hypothetical protein
MDTNDLQRRIETLETQMREHAHNGFLGGQIYFRHLFGLFETVSVAPTTIPKTTYDQIKIYVNGATLRLYWYDSVANLWHYVTASA